MKSSHQIAILAAVGVGAYLLLRSTSAAAGTVRPGMPVAYPTGTQPQVGTPAYSAWLAAQQQAQLDNAKLNALYGVGKMVNGWFSGSGSTGSAGNMTGSVRPSTDYGAGTYSPPDYSATNSPYAGSIVYTDQISGNIDLAPSDSAFLHSNEGYGFYTQ